jgi:predicted small secreted protein
MKRQLPLGLWAVLLSAALVALPGCNTIAGAGKDVQSVGKAVEKTAEKCKDGKC